MKTRMTFENPTTPYQRACNAMAFWFNTQERNCGTQNRLGVSFNDIMDKIGELTKLHNLSSAETLSILVVARWYGWADFQ